jgi:hypothetical protein
MTRVELHQLVERLPEIVLDGSHRRLALTYDELHELTQVVIELTYRLDTLTREWMESDGPRHLA